jgi:hypothetical protein
LLVNLPKEKKEISALLISIEGITNDSSMIWTFNSHRYSSSTYITRRPSLSLAIYLSRPIPPSSSSLIPLSPSMLFFRNWDTRVRYLGLNLSRNYLDTSFWDADTPTLAEFNSSVTYGITNHFPL